MKRTIQTLCLGIVVLVLVLLTNTLVVVRGEPQPQAVDPAPGEVSLDAALGRLSAAVQIPTISGDPDRTPDMVRFGEWLPQAFPLVFTTLSVEQIGNAFLLTWSGSDPSLHPAVIMAHYDVVPIEAGTESDWIHPPFSGAIADGAVWGRGTLDDKGPMLAILEAVHALIDARFTPRRTLLLIFGGDEEIGGLGGAVQVASHLRDQQISPAFVFDEGLFVTEGIVPGPSQPVAIIGTSERGYASVEVIATSEGGHSSAPPTQTSVGKLARAIHRIERRPMRADLVPPASTLLETVAPHSPFGQRVVLSNLWLFKAAVRDQLSRSTGTNAQIRTTFAPTMLSASPKDNVLAQQARAIINVRIRPGESLDDALDHMRRVVRDSSIEIRPVGDMHSEPAPIAPTELDAYRYLASSIKTIFSDTLVSPGLMVGATDSRHFIPLTNHIYRFSPLVVTKDDVPRFHGTNERITTDNYQRAIDFYRTLIHESTRITGSDSN